jgi:hypothetical protein
LVALLDGSTSMTEPVTIRLASATSSLIGSAGSVAASVVVVSVRIGCSF